MSRIQLENVDLSADEESGREPARVPPEGRADRSSPVMQTEAVHNPSRPSPVLRQLRYIDLPEHTGPGAFGQAAVHRARERVYIAHTANDALDVVDGERERYLHSIPGLVGVTDVLVSERRDLIFTANRSESAVGIFSPDREADLTKIPVGVRPSRLAFDPARNALMPAGYWDPIAPHSGGLAVIAVDGRAPVAEIPVPGRTVSLEYNQRLEVFYVSTIDPAHLVVIEAEPPTRIARIYMRPNPGPDCPEFTTQRLHRFSAGDTTKLPIFHPQTNELVDVLDLGGVPDQIVGNPVLHHLYASFGDSGMLQVFDLDALKLLDTVPTERGARAVAFYAPRKIFVPLPHTHRAAVYADTG